MAAGKAKAKGKGKGKAPPPQAAVEAPPPQAAMEAPPPQVAVEAPPPQAAMEAPPPQVAVEAPPAPPAPGNATAKAKGKAKARGKAAQPLATVAAQPLATVAAQPLAAHVAAAPLVMTFLQAATPAAEEACAVDSPPFHQLLEGEVFCNRCGNTCALSGVRVRSKREGTWQCTQCDVTYTQLHRMGTQIPCDKEAQTFFAQARGLDAKATKAVLEKFGDKWLTKEKIYELGGAYLPLQVWGTKGYPEDAIVEHSLPSDIKEDRMFGRVYRVPTLYVGKRDKETEEDGTRMTERARKRLKTAEKTREEEQAAQEEQAAKQERSSSSNSSNGSSSSSSSSEKKKKKDKNKKSKGKKSKKKQEKKKRKEKELANARKEQERQDGRAQQQHLKLAESILDKVSKTKAGLSNALSQPEVTKIPDAVIDPLSMALMEFRDLETVVKKVKSGDFTSAGAMGTAASVNQKIKVIQKGLTVLEMLVKAVRKHST
jgi:hypothetical protein